jgi:hypothetical protein
VTLTLAISAIGSTVPPSFIFPRVHFRVNFLMMLLQVLMVMQITMMMDESRTFLEFVEHFVSHVKPSKERPAVLLLDNHDSHLSIAALDYCKDNGVPSASHLILVTSFSRLIGVSMGH